MPKYNIILNLPGFSIVRAHGYQPLILEISYKWVRKKASYICNVHHELIGHRRSILRFKAYKLYCYSCKRYGNPRSME